MGERGRVHDHGRLVVHGPVHPTDHLRFVVGLADLDLKPQFLAQAVQSRRSVSRS